MVGDQVDDTLARSVRVAHPARDEPRDRGVGIHDMHGLDVD